MPQANPTDLNHIKLSKKKQHYTTSYITLHKFSLFNGVFLLIPSYNPTNQVNTSL